MPLYTVSFSFPGGRTNSALDERTYYPRKRMDRFGGWLTTDIKRAKTWKNIIHAHNWIDSREGFRNLYAATVIDLGHCAEYWEGR